MSNFVGIDLGTTNSAICSYDGSETRIWKSPEQNDVTPSVIYIDQRGAIHVGQRAYNVVPRYPESCARLFKRRMGEDTQIEVPTVSRTFTPEECSAEILKKLFSDLPEEIRNSSETGTVVTVPAAFNQKARNATRQAAEMAGIGKVELIQEPVAAVMSFMRVGNTDGIFLIYDLGGGTFDVAIAQSTGGKVNLLAHGGIEACGGRDFDRLIFNNIVLPSLRHENYNLPNEFPKNDPFLNIATRSSEEGKIKLSSVEEVNIDIPGVFEDVHLQDINDNEINQLISLHRNTLDKLITEKITDTINCARETMEECGVNSQNIDRIVWIGGPTHYKPLLDKVSLELGIEGDMSVNPMTAVAEGASIFAESIDWSSNDYDVKPIIDHISLGNELALKFNYTARTPSDGAKIAVRVEGEVTSGSEFQIDSLDTGWTSGRLPLKHGATIDVTLTNPGENTFKVVVYDAVGKLIEQNEIVITKTAAVVEAIPSPHSIAMEVLDRLGGRPILAYLIRKGDPLPHKGIVELKADEKLEAGSSHSLNFILREGEFEDDIISNEHIGDFKIEGADFDEGVIPVGADLTCNYEIKTSGEIKIEVEVPDISGIFESSGLNFYSPDEGKHDYTSYAGEVVEEGIDTRNRIDKIKEVVNDPKLEEATQKLATVLSLDPEESDPEKVKEAEQSIKRAKELREKVEKENRKEIHQIDLNDILTFFDMYCRQHARPSEERAFDNLVETAQRSIDNNDNDFKDHLNELKARNFEVLWRQPWFIIENFKQMVSPPHSYTDKSRFEELAMKGRQLLGRDPIRRYEEFSPAEKYQSAIIDDGTIDELRDVVRQMMLIPHAGGGAQNNVQKVVANVFKA